MFSIKRKITNRKYRDSIFVDLFSKDRDAKKNFLSLYNALHGTNLKLEETKIESVELKQILYMGYYNDVSMLINGRIVVLCEHQSTLNENMPLRCLLYIAKIYENLMPNDARFEKSVHPIPTPEFYVFYNGADDLPARSELRLSAAFIQRDSDKTPPLELIVPVLNLNKPAENSIIDRCPSLKGYAEFIRIVVEEQRKDKEAYMERAVKRAIKAGILTEYLTRKNREVENMYWGEYDYATDVKVQRREAYEQGISQGIAQGISQGIATGAHDKAVETARNALAMNLTAEQAAQISSLPLSEVQALQNR
ncbi:MAG: Rpn family recombination-promoting nuclease/putative transposase [Treponema sp.]|nr:Rpn family recombination-promoting nuclease/putative transposase [Treponema sp.]